MTALIVTATVALLAAIIGGVTGFVKLMEFVQGSAKALAQVESLESTVEELRSRLLHIENKVQGLEANNSSLTEQNRILLNQNNELHLQNQELTKQNGILMEMLNGGDDETEGTD